ncbi:unnamed protein product [Meganyctiphanes norvegica]|uniref:Uncharacterized protein n=1 Tax=Meganyctiphanes norvegica TaxID=48144 RepID=A0AAV2R244_MEGNR
MHCTGSYNSIVRPRSLEYRAVDHITYYHYTDSYPPFRFQLDKASYINSCDKARMLYSGCLDTLAFCMLIHCNLVVFALLILEIDHPLDSLVLRGRAGNPRCVVHALAVASVQEEEGGGELVVPITEM